MRKELRTIPCGLCKIDTVNLGTKRCDRCWELERRIERDLEITVKILLKTPLFNAILDPFIAEDLNKAYVSGIEELWERIVVWFKKDTWIIDNFPYDKIIKEAKEYYNAT